MGEQEFSPDEWRTLQFAPFWILSAVVGAYGNFDQSECEAFSRSLAIATSAPGRLTREVLSSITGDLGRATDDYRRDGRTIAAGLCAVSAILTKATTDEAHMFKDTMVRGIGEDVARARGRFGRVVSEEDAKTLELVAELLT